MGNDVYVKLREFMNTLPAGYPSIGLCVSTCPTEAISMGTKLGMEPPLKDFSQDTLQRIRTERHAIAIKAAGSIL